LVNENSYKAQKNIKFKKVNLTERNMNYLKIIGEIIKLRPPDKPKIVQYHVNAYSLVRRIKKILSYSSKSDKILFIGDDDFTSLVLYKLGYKHLTVVDIDEEILNLIKTYSKNSINTIQFDLRETYKGKYLSLKEEYDLFVTDPPYTKDGIRIFIMSGLINLKKRGIGIIILPYKYKERMRWAKLEFIEEFLIRNNLLILEIIPNCQKYYHGTKSSMAIIKNMKKQKDNKFKIKKLFGYKHFY